MPIYEYRCLDCGEVTEVIQRPGSRPLRKCKSCSGRLEKLVSRTAFLLKGGGWFAEGYAGAAEKKAKDKEKPAPKSEGGSASSPAATKSESKPKAPSK